MVFTIYGALAAHDLTPFDKVNKGRSNVKIQYLKQGVKLDGLGTMFFALAQQTAEEIKDHFDRAFPHGKLEYECSETFDVGNRIFTIAKETVDEDVHIPFCKDTDPNGRLEKIACEGFKQTSDNVVRYFEGKLGSDGEWRYKTIGPQYFRTGDIVSLKMSFVVVPLKGGKFKMINVIRSITLLDGSFKQKEGLNLQSISAGLVLKRKIRYDTEEEKAKEEERKKKSSAMQ
ncbi:hypothetical protein C0993_007812, partial [Termitomyces sp. T159_Od127]